MAANVAVAQDPAGNLKPAKDKSTERIGGIVSLIMAMGRVMLPMSHVRPVAAHPGIAKGYCAPGFGQDHPQDPLRTSQHRHWG
jgi:phage terminase large subunit-like protein